MNKLCKSLAIFAQQNYNKKAIKKQQKSNTLKMGDLTKLNEVLIEKNKLITTYDKNKASEKLGLSIFTINKYLRGDGENAGTAERLIRFFKKCIKKRQELLEEALSD